MNLRALAVATVAAILAIAVVCVIYLHTFGTTLAVRSEIWAQFGDYFGGVLNPLFALAAFLSALWSIRLQQVESRNASVQLSEQTDIARRELEAISTERQGEELLHVIRDIDGRLSALLQEVVSQPNSPSKITITHMVAEANRVANHGQSSAALDEFVRVARIPGSVVEAPIREIAHLVLKLQEFLEYYSKLKAMGFAPILVYYADKAYQLTRLLEAVGAIPLTTRDFFATASDAHG